MLVTTNPTPHFDLAEVKRGTLIWAKHHSWSEAEMGYVTSADEDELRVSFPPRIQNVTNHFYIPAKEVAAGQWEIRYTSDMESISKYPEVSTSESEAADL